MSVNNVLTEISFRFFSEFLMWYLKKISWIAIVGFIAGVLVFILQASLLNNIKNQFECQLNLLKNTEPHLLKKLKLKH